MKATEKEKAAFRRYAQDNKEQIREYHKKYYQANKGKLRKQQKARYDIIKDNPDRKLREYKRRRQWWEENKELHRGIARTAWHKLKKEVLIYYSNREMRCAKCGFADIRALSLDHIGGGGCEHRRQIKNFYSWLRKNGYPRGYQVLCMNCQFIKRAENNECKGPSRLIKEMDDD